MRYVIIGAGPAGVEAAFEIRRRDPDSDVTVVGAEPYPPYSRVLLSYLIAGMPMDRVYVWGRNVFRRLGAEHIMGVGVQGIDHSRNVVLLSDGGSVCFDRLLISSGASARASSVPGAELDGVTVLRSLADAKVILSCLGSAKAVLVVGGGFVSLKAAEALWATGKCVTVVVSSSQILSQGMSARAACVVQRSLEQKGIRFLLETDVSGFCGRRRVRSAVLSNGAEVECDLAVIGKGVTPSCGFLQNAGVEVRAGVVVDDRMATTREGVYAAGDVAETCDLARREPRVNALWPNAVEQARVAAANMAGDDAKYAGSISMNATRFAGLHVMSCGVTRPKDQDEAVGAFFGSGCYRELVFRQGRLIGSTQVGEVINAGALYWAVRNEAVGIERAGLVMSLPLSYGDAVSACGAARSIKGRTRARQGEQR
ncbi:MAG TPA: hypothetical protein DDZ84_01770 [Firmicutes bacterium]|nr:hypothetical protein [Bacillota bacterium]